MVGGTQSEDAYAQVKALVQANYNPKFLFFANGANSPTEFPDKVGAKNVNGIFSCSDWTPTAPSNGNKVFVSQYLKRYGGQPVPDRQQLGRGVGGRPAPAARRAEDRLDQQPDDHRHAAQGHLVDDRGQPLLGRERPAERRGSARRVGEGEAAPGVPEAVRARQALLTEAGLGPLAARPAQGARLHPGLHPRPAHRRRLCADGERPGSGLRSHEGDQRRTGGVDHPRGLPELHAVQGPRHRPIRRAGR